MKPLSNYIYELFVWRKISNKPNHGSGRVDQRATGQLQASTGDLFFKLSAADVYICNNYLFQGRSDRPKGIDVSVDGAPADSQDATIPLVEEMVCLFFSSKCATSQHFWILQVCCFYPDEVQV